MDGSLLCDSLVEIIMAKKNKIEIGSVSQYVETQGISRSKAQKELEKGLAYTLHKQRCRRGVFQPVVVFDVDQQ